MRYLYCPPPRASDILPLSQALDSAMEYKINHHHEELFMSKEEKLINHAAGFTRREMLGLAGGASAALLGACRP